MAILTGINTRLSGSAGDWTFARVNGQTVAKQKVEKKAVPVRTLRQQRRRMQWKNIINLYSAFDGNNHPSFQDKEQGQTDYLMFMSSNLDLAPVYLTKSEARQGASIVAPYQVSRGSLPSIAVSGDSVKKTDIALGSTFSITASTTLKDFSEAVLGANGQRFRHGDQITCFIAHQLVNPVTGVPYVSIQAQAVTLNAYDSATLLRAVAGAEGFSVVDGKLGAGATVNGGIAWVHSRAVGNSTKVSSQNFVVTNSILSLYQGSAHLQAAIDSYGGVNKEEYLTPDNPDIEAPDTDPRPGPAPQSQVTLTLRSNNPDAVAFTVNGEPYNGPMEFAPGATVTIHAEPKEGWSLLKWQDSQSAEPDREVTLAEDTTLVINTEEA